MLLADSSVHDMYKKAEEYYRQGMIENSIDVLEKVIQKDPTFISAYYLLGKIYKEINDYDKAMSYFEKCIELRQDLRKREKSLEESGIPKVKIEMSDVLKKIEEAEDILSQGIRFVEEGDFLSAENSFKYAIDLNPNVAEYYFRLADVYLDRQLDDLAISTLKKGLRIDTINTDRYILLASLYSKSGDDRKAVHLLKTAATDHFKDNLKFRDLIKKYSANIIDRRDYTVIRRDGNEVIINAGFRDGIKRGMEFRTHLTVYRGGTAVKDLNTGEILGQTERKVIGEILITKVEEKLTYGQITIEKEDKIRIGDFISIE